MFVASHSSRWKKILQQEKNLSFTLPVRFLVLNFFTKIHESLEKSYDSNDNIFVSLSKHKFCIDYLHINDVKEKQGKRMMTFLWCPEYAKTTSFVLSFGEFLCRGKTRNAAINKVGQSVAIRDDGLTTREPRSDLKYSSDSYTNLVSWSNIETVGERIQIRRNYRWIQMGSFLRRSFPRITNVYINWIFFQQLNSWNDTRSTWTTTCREWRMIVLSRWTYLRGCWFLSMDTRFEEAQKAFERCKNNSLIIEIWVLEYLRQKASLTFWIILLTFKFPSHIRITRTIDIVWLRSSCSMHRNISYLINWLRDVSYMRQVWFRIEST